MNYTRTRAFKYVCDICMRWRSGSHRWGIMLWRIFFGIMNCFWKQQQRLTGRERGGRMTTTKQSGGNGIITTGEWVGRMVSTHQWSGLVFRVRKSDRVGNFSNRPKHFYFWVRKSFSLSRTHSLFPRIVLPPTQWSTRKRWGNKEKRSSVFGMQNALLRSSGTETHITIYYTFAHIYGAFYVKRGNVSQILDHPPPGHPSIHLSKPPTHSTTTLLTKTKWNS